MRSKKLRVRSKKLTRTAASEARAPNEEEGKLDFDFGDCRRDVRRDNLVGGGGGGRREKKEED